MQTKELTTDKGVTDELRRGQGCHVTTRRLTDTEPWTRFAAVWEGAKENQDVEVCLRRDPSDQEVNKISGTVWVDDVA